MCHVGIGLIFTALGMFTNAILYRIANRMKGLVVKQDFCLSSFIRRIAFSHCIMFCPSHTALSLSSQAVCSATHCEFKACSQLDFLVHGWLVKHGKCLITLTETTFLSPCKLKTTLKSMLSVKLHVLAIWL